jgi:protein-S-isoprenylcysteine O-methyltransferase Ste14
MKPMENILKWVFKLRGVVMVPPIIFAVLCTWSEIEDPPFDFSVGGAFFIAGWFLRVWSQMHLHYRLKIHKALTLTGPYIYVRNPIYIGNTLMLVGAVIMSELLWFAPAMLVYCVVVYSIVVRYEESHLLAKYGSEYAYYMSKVPRWIPNPLSTGASAIFKVRQFLFPSILAEMPSLLLLLPFIVKDWLF